MNDEPSSQEQQEYLEKIGRYVRGVRHELEYTRLRLAEELSVSVDVIISVENAETDIQTATYLFNRVRALLRNRLN